MLQLISFVHRLVSANQIVPYNARIHIASREVNNVQEYENTARRHGNIEYIVTEPSLQSKCWHNWKRFSHVWRINIILLIGLLPYLKSHLDLKLHGRKLKCRWTFIFDSSTPCLYILNMMIFFLTNLLFYTILTQCRAPVNWPISILYHLNIKLITTHVLNVSLTQCILFKLVTQ